MLKTGISLCMAAMVAAVCSPAWASGVDDAHSIALSKDEVSAIQLAFRDLEKKKIPIEGFEIQITSDVDGIKIMFFRPAVEKGNKIYPTPFGFMGNASYTIKDGKILSVKTDR